jgi:rhamnosyltransferase subunit B
MDGLSLEQESWVAMKNQTVSDILLCTIGSAGDVYPFVGIAQELQKRGYGVTLITSQFFETQARDAGLEFLGLGSAEDYQSIIQNPDLWDPEKSFQSLCRKRGTPDHGASL